MEADAADLLRHLFVVLRHVRDLPVGVPGEYEVNVLLRVRCPRGRPLLLFFLAGHVIAQVLQSTFLDLDRLRRSLVRSETCHLNLDDLLCPRLSFL